MLGRCRFEQRPERLPVDHAVASRAPPILIVQRAPAGAVSLSWMAVMRVREFAQFGLRIGLAALDPGEVDLEADIVAAPPAYGRSAARRRAAADTRIRDCARRRAGPCRSRLLGALARTVRRSSSSHLGIVRPLVRQQETAGSAAACCRWFRQYRKALRLADEAGEGHVDAHAQRPASSSRLRNARGRRRSRRPRLDGVIADAFSPSSTALLRRKIAGGVKLEGELERRATSDDGLDAAIRRLRAA